MTTNERDDWAERGACHGSGLNFFSLRNTTKLKETCDNCPVIDECLEYALFPKMQSHGYWAGTTPDDRIEILRTHPRAVAARKGKKPMGNPRHREAREAKAR